MKPLLSRLFHAALIVGAAVVASSVAGPGTARAENKYVVPPGRGDASTMNLRTIVSDPLFAGDNTTIAYMPSQYLVISKTPILDVQIKGGFWGCEDWGGARRLECSDPRGDRAAKGSFGHQFVWEFYQLSDLNRGNGQLKAAIGAQDKGFWGTNPSGDEDRDWKQILLAGDGRVRFQSSQYPQFNNYYVYLVKQVADEDQRNGYVDTVDGIRGPADEYPTEQDTYQPGCVYNGGGGRGNNIKCPVKWRKATARVSRGPAVAQNAHYIKVTGDNMITSAPSRIAFNTRYNQDYNETDRTGRGFTVNTTGRQDNCAARGAPEYDRRSIINIDWDRASERQKPDPPPGSEGDIFHPDALKLKIGGYTYYNTAGYGTYPWNPPTLGAYPWNLPRVNDNPFSAGWSGSGSHVYWPYAVGDNTKAPVTFRGLNAGNNLYMGGAYFTTGDLPGCDVYGSAVWLRTPKGDGLDRWRWNNSPPYLGNLYFPYYNNGTNHTIFTPGHNPAYANQDYKAYNYVFNGHPNGENTNFFTQYRSYNQRPFVKRATTFDGGPWYSWALAANKSAVDAGGAFTYADEPNDPNSPIDLPLTPGPHRFVACASEIGWSVGPVNYDNSYTDDAAYWACGLHDFYSNKAPVTTNLTPPNGARTNYNCFPADYLRFKVDDPEGSPVRSQVYFSWTGPKGSGNKATAQSGVKASGSEFNSNDLSVDGKPLWKFFHDDIPEGSDVTWHVVASDTYGASDISNVDRISSFALGQQYGVNNMAGGLDNYGYGNYSQPVAPYKRQAGPSWTFHKNTRANLDRTASTKKLYEAKGTVPLDPANGYNVPDGQTVRVETTLKNSGETPAKAYELKDYFGPVRDFEALPGGTGVSIRHSNGAAVGLEATNTNDPAPAKPSVLRAVQAGDVNDPNDEAALKGNGDKLLSQGDLAERSKTKGAAWRFDIPVATFQGKPGFEEIKPGESVTLTYYMRANRNLSNPTTPDGKDNPADPNDKDYQRSLTITPSRFYTKYQYDYCDPALREHKVNDFAQPHADAPFVRGQRGSVGSNGSINAYAKSGATYTVTALAGIKNFDGTNIIENYKSSNSCDLTDKPTGVDWRKELFKNAQRLLADKGRQNEVKDLNDLEKPGVKKLTNKDGKNVWVVTPSSGTAEWNPAGKKVNPAADNKLSGVGTIIVKGNLTIKSDMGYQDAGNKADSLGVIVLGNLTIDPAVSKIVGSYFVLDGEMDGDKIKTADGNPDCPLINRLGSSGTISTGDSSVQLTVDGLMIGRKFELQRRYTKADNPNTPGDEGAEANQAAEYVYYDGRVVAATPPGFATFRQTTSWYEIAP